MKTLQQLIQSHAGPSTVVVPLATVTDWPDLAERGEWGGVGVKDVAWFAERKLNLMESHAGLAIDKDGHGVATIDDNLLHAARLHAVKIVPIVTHLDYLGDSGIYGRYPELKGVGESASAPVYDHPIALCFSKPKSGEILAEWIASLAEAEGVTDISVWLSEYGGQCDCAACRKAAANGAPQHVLEMRAVGRAIELARAKASASSRPRVADAGIVPGERQDSGRGPGKRRHQLLLRRRPASEQLQFLATR